MPIGKGAVKSRPNKAERDPFWDPLDNKKTIQSKAQQVQSVADEWTSELRHRQKKEPGLKDTWKKKK